MSNININEALTLKGHLTIQKKTSSGSITTLVDDKNLIVLSGRNAITYMLAGKVSSSAISDVAFGKDGVLPTNPSIVKTVLPTDTAVNSRITDLVAGTDYIFNIDTAGETTTPKVVISIVVPEIPLGYTGTTPNSAGLNGENISELALMMVDTAFSIKRFSNITKSQDFSILINWAIYA